MLSRIVVPEISAPTILVGTDIVEVQRVQESILHFGERYVSRVYTRDEAKYCMSAGHNPAPHFAARFAAKEATVKVLRISPSEPFDWRSIEVVRNDDGWCELRLHGRTQRKARDAGLGPFALSLSHEERYATAVVLAERRQRRHIRVSRARSNDESSSARRKAREEGTARR
jgi:holo-[acyl-carrier protein] synthase